MIIIIVKTWAIENISIHGKAKKKKIEIKIKIKVKTPAIWNMLFSINSQTEQSVIKSSTQEKPLDLWSLTKYFSLNNFAMPWGFCCSCINSIQ